MLDCAPARTVTDWASQLAGRNLCIVANDTRARHGLRAAASLRETQERAILAQKLEVATSKYDAEVRERASEISVLRRLAETTRPREQDGGQQRLREGVTEGERWNLIKMVNAKVVLFFSLLLCETSASLIGQRL